MIPSKEFMKFNLYLDACLLLCYLPKSILINAQMVSRDKKEPKSKQMKNLQEKNLLLQAHILNINWLNSCEVIADNLFL